VRVAVVFAVTGGRADPLQNRAPVLRATGSMHLGKGGRKAWVTLLPEQEELGAEGLLASRGSG
jgi:hypothetical protein